MAVTAHCALAAWNLYRISRQNGRWTTEVTVRTWNAGTRQLATTRQFTLST